MRVRRYAVGLTLCCVAALTMPNAAAAPEDPDGTDGTVSQQDVDNAQARADAAATDVGSVQAQLARAQQRLEAAQVDAAKAA